MVFLAGGLAGAFLFAESWPLISGLATEAYRGPVKINEMVGLSPSLFTLILIIVAGVMFWLAEKAERKFARPDITSEL
jgi:hypothetical protein